MKSKITLQLTKFTLLAAISIFCSLQLKAQCHDFSTGPYTTSFESGQRTGWTTVDNDGDGVTWDTVPADPNNGFPHTGITSMRILTDVSVVVDDWLFSKCMSLVAGKTYQIDFWYVNRNYPTRRGSLEVTLNSAATPDSVTQSIIDLGEITTSSYKLSSKQFTASTTGDFYFGFNATNVGSTQTNIRVDDILINEVVTQDAGIAKLTSPISTGCTLTNSETFTINIKNYGSQNISNIPVYFSVNSTVTGPETVSNTITPGSSYTYSFTAKADLSAIGIYDIKVFTGLGGDGAAWNDTISLNIPSVTPYDLSASTIIMGFEPGDNFSSNGWNVLDANNDGITWGMQNVDPAGIHSGNYSFQSNLNQNLATDDWFFSPCLSLSTSKVYAVSFWVSMANARDFQIFLMNGQNPANKVDTIGNYQGYATTYVLHSWNFTVPTDGDYNIGFHDLSGQSTNGSIFMDDMRIYEVSQYDGGVSAILLPQTGSCSLLVDDTVSIRIINYGSDTISDIPVSYTVNGGTPVNETVIIDLPSGFYVDYTFSQTVDLSAKGTYDIVAYTSVTSDGGSWNDTMKSTVYSFHNDINSATYNAGFETSLELEGWLIYNTNLDARRWFWSGVNDSASAYSGGGYFFIDSSQSVGNDDWFMTPCMTFNAANTYALSFYYATDTTVSIGNFTHDFQVHIGAGNDAASMDPNPIYTNSGAYTDPASADYAGKGYMHATATFTVPASGDYFLGWHDVSVDGQSYLFIDAVSVSKASSINEKKSINDLISIAPNPSNGKFIINNNLQNKENLSVEVSNILGQVIGVFNLGKNTSYSLDLSNQQDGIYFVKIKTSGETITKKVVISR